MGKRIFGIAARADESAHVVAFGWHAHAFATGDGPAGDFKARNIALARRGRIDALPLQAIGPVDARRRDFDQNLAGSGFWDRRLADSYDVRAAMALEIYLPHHERDFSAKLLLNQKRIPVRRVS
jgi:hypothetical protein